MGWLLEMGKFLFPSLISCLTFPTLPACNPGIKQEIWRAPDAAFQAIDQGGTAPSDASSLQLISWEKGYAIIDSLGNAKNCKSWREVLHMYLSILYFCSPCLPWSSSYDLRNGQRGREPGRCDICSLHCTRPRSSTHYSGKFRAPFCKMRKAHNKMSIAYARSPAEIIHTEGYDQGCHIRCQGTTSTTGFAICTFLAGDYNHI
jgi:hypothetical protein